MTELFADSLLNKQGDKVDIEELKSKVIGLYFGAEWSPPCQEWCNQLKTAYGELKERIAPIEIIYIPCDKTEDEYQKSIDSIHKDWFTMSHNHPLVELTIQKYEVTVIPKLVIIKDDATLISSKGRKEILEKGTTGFRNWATAANLSDWERKAVKKKASEARNVLRSLNFLKAGAIKNQNE